MIEVQGLYHSYTRDESYAVADVSFAVAKGEVFGFLGPKRPHLRQVTVGILMTRDGMPIGHQVFPGNFADSGVLWGGLG